MNSFLLITFFGIAFTLILGLHTYSHKQKSITLQLGPTSGRETKVTTVVAPTKYERSPAEVQGPLPQFNNTPYFYLKTALKHKLEGEEFTTIILTNLLVTITIILSIYKLSVIAKFIKNAITAIAQFPARAKLPIRYAPICLHNYSAI